MDKVALYKEINKNKNTLKATNTWIRNYKRWAEKKELEKDL